MFKWVNEQRFCPKCVLTSVFCYTPSGGCGRAGRLHTLRRRNPRYVLHPFSPHATTHTVTDRH